MIKLPEGTKTNSGLAIVFIAVATFIGFDITDVEATKLVEAITALTAVMGTILAKYGADDKEARLRKAKQKVIDFETKDEVIKKAQEIVKNL